MLLQNSDYLQIQSGKWFAFQDKSPYIYRNHVNISVTVILQQSRSANQDLIANLAGARSLTLGVAVHNAVHKNVDANFPLSQVVPAPAEKVCIFTNAENMI